MILIDQTGQFANMGLTLGRLGDFRLRHGQLKIMGIFGQLKLGINFYGLINLL